MSDEPDNLVLQLLRNIRADVADVRSDVSEVRSQLSQVRSGLSEVRSDLSEVRSDLSQVDKTLVEVRRVVTSHSMRFDALDERVETLREGTLTAIGFAANAAQSQKKLQEQVADLAKRVEKLERTQ